MVNLETAAGIAWRVFELAPSIPGRLTDPRLVFLRGFPSGSCDSMAYATAGMLFERGLGDWWVVTQVNDEGDRHVWLEWRSETHQPLFSIDATAHQFVGIEEPFIGHGPTPSSRWFSEPESAVRFTDLADYWPRAGDVALLEYVQAYMP